jgi:AraC family transcriptional regulator
MPYEMLENALIEIEKGLNDGINADSLAEKYGLSSGHLRRLFKFAFNQSLSSYIRSRRLSASLNDLLTANSNILDIALDYGFEYEQSYIRAFKQEFGITPGDLRVNKKIVKVKPPIHLFDENKLADGAIFGPDIVMIPQFHVVGKLHRMALNDSRTILAGQFWKNDLQYIKAAISPHVYIGLTRNFNRQTGYSEYLTSVQVKNFKNIPKGFHKDIFNTSLCAKYRYIGQHHYSNIDRNLASPMYDAIKSFTSYKHSKYSLAIDKIFFEMINTKYNDGSYSQMEWFAPVVEKC